MIFILLLQPSPILVCAAEHHIECPLKVEPESLQVINPPPSWTGFVPLEFWLHSAGPMGGPPSTMTVLADQTYSKRGNKITSKWTFNPKDREEAFPHGIWLACSYGDRNDVTLANRRQHVGMHRHHHGAQIGPKRC
jgi:hypothetical protein